MSERAALKSETFSLGSPVGFGSGFGAGFGFGMSPCAHVCIAALVGKLARLWSSFPPPSLYCQIVHGVLIGGAVVE